MAVNLQAKLSLESRGFNNSLKQADSKTKSFGASFGKLKGMIGAGLALGGITATIKQFGEAADNIDNLAVRLGTTTERIQKFQIAADQTGQSVEVISDAYKTLKVRSQEAAAGNEILQKQFDALGISQADLESQNIDLIFDKLNIALTNSPDQVETLAVAMKLLGEPVEKLVPMLDAMNSNFESVVSEKNVKSLDKMEHNWSKHWRRMKTSAMNTVGWLGDIGMKIADPFVGGIEDPAKLQSKRKDQEAQRLKSLKDIKDKEKKEEEAAEAKKKFDKEQVAIDRAKASADSAQRKNLLDKLSSEEKIAKFKKEQNKLLEEAEKLSQKGRSHEEEYFKVMAKAHGLTGDIRKEEGKKDTSLGSLRIQGTSMQQAGARIAGVDKRIAMINQKQLGVQQEILKHIREGGGLFTYGADGKMNPYTGS